MSSKILFLFVVFLFFIGVEFILLGVCRGAPSTNKAKVIWTICRVILETIIIAYILLIGLFLWVGVDMILSSNVGQGVSVLASGAIMGVCVYFWLIRGWIKHMKKLEKDTEC